jgi:hypothetical protein
MRFGETGELDALQTEAPNVVECFTHAFARKTVESPNDHDIEWPARGIRHHRAEPWAVTRPAGFMVLILGNDVPPLRLAKCPELVQLVRGFLAFVGGRNAGVEGGSHRKPPANMGLPAGVPKNPGGQLAAKVLNASRVGSHTLNSTT